MAAIQELLGERSSAMIYAVVDAEGLHHETYWRKWFTEFYLWIMADGFNKVVRIEE